MAYFILYFIIGAVVTGFLIGIDKNFKRSASQDLEAGCLVFLAWPLLIPLTIVYLVYSLTKKYIAKDGK